MCVLTRCLAPSFIIAFTSSFAFSAEAPKAVTQLRQVPMLSANDQLKTIELPDGYRLELVLSEPDIKEPVLCVFDGNGRMYVAELRTYMQDIDGTAELTNGSRISRHESSKGDGVFDKHSVYLDNVLLPRMILPLDDRVLVGLTNSSDLTMHRDKDGDGVSDEQSLWFAGGERGGNLEHQPSGLVWGLDNWIYTTYNSYRLRWNGPEAPLKENTAGNGGQWGLAQDDFGKMWFSNAGGEKGIWNYQTPILYAAINVSSQKSADFDNVWPLIGAADYQGGTNRARPDNTLNHFTGACGQTVFRGDRLPAELRGNVFLPEPVGRLIRRATVEVKDGITTVTNPHGQSEFLRSSDLNFRPVNTTTGPDGCLYIVDMYRGIIQEGNWVREGSYLRDKVVENGFQNNVGKGRIWRLTHKDFKPGPQPKMLDETATQLVAHLAHPNGWWRDTAQRMLIIKKDISVVPALTQMAQSNANPIARIHAIWTLEGLNFLTPALVTEKLKDDNAQVRATTIRAAETLLKKGDQNLISSIKAMRSDSDPNVVLQALMTSKLLNFPDWKKEAQNVIFLSPSLGVKEIGAQFLVEPPKLAGKFTDQDRKRLEKGQETFRTLCFACHGFDGKGMPMPGRDGVLMAPPLAASKTVLQNDFLLRVLLHGLAGPVDGVTYESQMVPMGTNSDDWLADIASYVRKAFGNQGALVTKDEIKKLRAELKGRTAPWTIEELRSKLPQTLSNVSEWKLSASHNVSALDKAIDGNAKTRWSANKFQTGDEWIVIELPAETEIAGVELDSTPSANDFPRGYEISISNDGTDWKKPLLTGNGSSAISELLFPESVSAKFIRIKQTGSAKGNFWSIHELRILTPAESKNVPAPAK